MKKINVLDWRVIRIFFEAIVLISVFVFGISLWASFYIAFDTSFISSSAVSILNLFDLALAYFAGVIILIQFVRAIKLLNIEELD